MATMRQIVTRNINRHKLIGDNKDSEKMSLIVQTFKNFNLSISL